MTPETVCPTCGGRGHLYPDAPRGKTVPACPQCHGTGRIPAQESETDSKDFDELLRRAARPNVDTLIEYWIAQGRSEEQIHGVRNFFSGVGRVLKSPAEAEQSSTLSDSSIPPTPAGEGELEQILDHYKDWVDRHDWGASGYEGELSQSDALAAINAYIARRVLEVIGEDDQVLGDPTFKITTNAVRYRNQLRAEQRQRIAVIKKESQQ